MKPLTIFLLLFLTSGLNAYPARFSLQFSSRYNYRQGYNECGPFSAKAVITILKGKDIPIGEAAGEIKWRLKNGNTLPWGLEAYLKKNHIFVDTPNFFSVDDSEKIEILKKNLAAGKPVIVLIGLGKYQHYITLVGYENAYFYVYDSLHTAQDTKKGYTIDSNGYLPGNKNLSIQSFLKLWSKGGMYGFYSYYGIVCS